MALVFLGALFFFTRANTFPFYGHADEPGKAEQVLYGKRNFNHPVLMLNSAALVNAVVGQKDDFNRATLIGRWAVAAYAAGAVALLSLLVARLMGDLSVPMRGLVFATSGLVIASTPQLVEFAHYFKEDPVLCFGLAAFLVAAEAFGRRPSRGTLLALVLAMSLAASGKYLGALVLPLGLWLIWRRASPSWWSYRVPVLVAAGAVFLLGFFLINYQGIRGIESLADSIVEETQKSLDRPDGIDRPIPNSMGWTMLVETTTRPIWLFLIAGLGSLLLAWRRLRPVEVFLVLIPLVFAVIICFTDKMAERYFLPVSTLVSCIAAIGLIRLAQWGAHRQPRGRVFVAGALALIGAGLVIQSRAATIQNFWQQHEGDPRRDMVIFIRDHLPDDAKILSDKRARLPNAEQPENNVYRIDFPQEVVLAEHSQFAADYAPFEELKARGITHVALCEPDWGRFFINDGQQPISSTDPKVLSRIAFYSQVLKQGRLVWESPAREINIVWPGLRLYELP
jgi:hypothetical protein